MPTIPDINTTIPDIDARIHDSNLSYQIREVIDRTRRIETRLTSYLEAQGHPTNARKPVWEHEPGLGWVVKLPSLQTSFKDILDVIPRGIDEPGPLDIEHHGKIIARLTVLP